MRWVDAFPIRMYPIILKRTCVDPDDGPLWHPLAPHILIDVSEVWRSRFDRESPD